MKSLFARLRRWATLSNLLHTVTVAAAGALVTGFVLFIVGGHDTLVLILALGSMFWAFVAFALSAIDLFVGVLLSSIVLFTGGAILVSGLESSQNDADRTACVEALVTDVDDDLAAFDNRETARHYSALIDDLREKAKRPGYPAISVEDFCEDVAGLRLDIEESARVEALG